MQKLKDRGKQTFKLLRSAQGIRSKIVALAFVIGTIFLFPFRQWLGMENYHKLRFLFLFTHIYVKNEDGTFYCRKRTDDFGLVSIFHEKSLRKSFVLGQGVFVDVGAHIGKYTVMVGNQIKGKGRVIAIEPDPKNFAVLQKNIQLNSMENVFSFNVAAASKEGERDFFVDSFNTGHSTFYGEGQRRFRKIEVACQRLDTILAAYGVSRIDLLKIDVEGAEEGVLEGLGSYLFQTKVIIYEDFTNRATSFLRARGFRITATEYPIYKIAYYDANRH